MKNILAGYDNHDFEFTLKSLGEVLKDNELPYSEWQQQISALHSRLPPKLDDGLTALVERTQSRGAEFPARQI